MGGFCPEMLELKENSQFYGSEETFLFLLEPYQKKFSSTFMNRDFISTCKESFSMGSEKLFMLCYS